MSLNTALLAETFRRAAQENGGARALGLRFYERLFQQYPTVKPLFSTEPEQQHKKLMASIGATVAGINNTEMLLPYLHALGIRHLKYKAENAHYPAVAENLVAVLGEHLGKEGEWTEEMAATWTAAIHQLAAIMIEAADHPDQYREELIGAGYQPDGFKAKDPEPWLIAV